MLCNSQLMFAKNAVGIPTWAYRKCNVMRGWNYKICIKQCQSFFLKVSYQTCSELTFTCSKSTMKTPEQYVKSVQIY